MSLVARYPLTDPLGSTVAVEIVNGRYGSYGGTPVQDLCGTDFGGSGSGDQFLSSNNAALAPNTAGSISCWLKWPSVAGGSVRDYSNNFSGDNGWVIATAFQGTIYTGQIDYRVGGTIVSTGLSPSYLVGFDRHWIVTWDATSSVVYLDGSLFFTGPAPGAQAIQLPWTIGRNGGANEWIQAHALDFRIYNHKLSAAEAQAVYEEGQPCRPAPVGSGVAVPLRRRQSLVTTPRMRQQVR